MTVENISWSISTKECCRPRRGLNPRPPGLQSDGASNLATEAGPFFRRGVKKIDGVVTSELVSVPLSKSVCYKMVLVRLNWPREAKNCLWTCANCAFRSSRTCAKYHPGLCIPFIHSVVASEWMPYSDCADSQVDLGLRCPHMPKDTFSHGTGQLSVIHVIYNLFPDQVLEKTRQGQIKNMFLE